jgi:hypothetical protein
MKIPDNKTWFKILLILLTIQIIAYFVGWAIIKILN